ncbi:MAG: dihydrofolate reductase [Myxococcota bacterium]|nr:dihydrofolate reductase [Myxococcota bacterium]MDW8363733.1 dihydrofolate reductase [Myxococcales bacterium]
MAMSRDGCIGRGGRLPWHLPEDLAHFRRTTMGHAVVMGRRTFESIGRPLPGRRNLVLSRNPAYAPAGVEVCSSLQDALRRAMRSDSMPFVIGGARVYEEALLLATCLFVTHVDVEVPDCDARFPPIDPARWRVVEQREGATPGVRFVRYARRDG